MTEHFAFHCAVVMTAEQKRLAYLEELGKHMDVHSYGNCLHNKNEPPAPEVGQTTPRGHMDSLRQQEGA